MNEDQFRSWSRRAAEWGADYRASLPDRPVRAQSAPGEIFSRIAAHPPEMPESMEAIFADFEETILPGITHWQHPRFFAYFPRERGAGFGDCGIPCLGNSPGALWRA